MVRAFSLTLTSNAYVPTSFFEILSYLKRRMNIIRRFVFYNRQERAISSKKYEISAFYFGLEPQNAYFCRKYTPKYLEYTKIINNMKKIFTSAFLLCAAMSVNAQTAFKVSPDYYNFNESEGTEIYFLGERASSNGSYVVGMDQMNLTPYVWNVETGEGSLLVVTDKGVEYEWNDDWTEIIGETEIEMPRSGSFHAVSNTGLAVGGTTNQVTYATYPCVYNIATGEYTELKCDEGIDWEGNPVTLGAEAYGITDDGETIAGFRFLEDGWNVTGCVWTDGGQTRTDLPWPSVEELGVEVDYASARGISADGSVIWGYAQDANTGAWVACHWTKNEEGQYEAHSWAGKYYQTTIYDEETWEPIEVENPNPWCSFEPVGMSENGEWMTLILTKEVALGPWAQACNYAARLNLKSGFLQVLDMGQDADGNDITGPELFGIANDGTAVGRLTGVKYEYDEVFEDVIPMEAIDAVVWPIGSKGITKLADSFAEDAYAEGWTASALSYISGDAKSVMGYASDELGGQTTFVVDFPTVEDVTVGLPAAVEKIEDLYNLNVTFGGATKVEESAYGLLAAVFDAAGEPVAVCFPGLGNAQMGSVSVSGGAVTMNFGELAEADAETQSVMRAAAAKIGKNIGGGSADQATVVIAGKSFLLNGVTTYDKLIKKTYTFGEGAGQTGIETLTTKAESVRYDLQGRRTNNAGGLQIVNGVKVVK